VVHASKVHRRKTKVSKYHGRKAGGYGRISEDPEELRLGTARQEGDITSHATRLGVSLFTDQATSKPVFVDDDISASKYSRKPRPAYRRLLRAIDEEGLSVIVCWAIDRLLRRNDELEDLIKLAERRGQLDVVTPTMEFDLTDDTQQTMLRMMVSMAGQESANISRRVKRQREEARKEGRLPPGAAFGWRGQGQHEQEAAYVLDMATQLMEGESLGNIARWLEVEGVLTRRGGKHWTASQVKRVLETPRHYGHLTYEGKMVQRDNHKGILPGDMYEEVLTVLGLRQHKERRPARRTWLTDLVYCHHCDRPVVRNVLKGRTVLNCKPRRSQPEACGGTVVPVALVAGAVQRAVIDYVDSLDLASLAAPDGRASAAKLTAQLGRLAVQAQANRQRYAQDIIDDNEYTETAVELRQAESGLRRQLAALSTNRVLRRYAGQVGALEAAWPDLSDEARAAVVREALALKRAHIVVMPHQGRRNVIDPNRVQLVPGGKP
jgi:site-specific DNA recombinase